MEQEFVFTDRRAAGNALANALEHLKGSPTVVLGIPRGGIPVAAEIARILGIPLDILLSKKIGHPTNPEFAVGAVTAQDSVIDADQHLDPSWVVAETEQIRAGLREKRRLLKGDRPDVSLSNRTVIIVDDGIATGKTLLATLPMIRRQRPARIIIAVPVAPLATYRLLLPEVDELIVLHIPRHFSGVGAYYEDFTQVEDAEVAAILNDA